VYVLISVVVVQIQEYFRTIIYNYLQLEVLLPSVKFVRVSVTEKIKDKENNLFTLDRFIQIYIVD
jgi:hypothetical protein